jgi:hypothetical protein
MDEAIRARFAIFRRSAVPAGRRLGRELSRDFTLASYYPAYVRRVSGRYYVLPAFGRREAIPVPGCASVRARRELAAQQRHRAVEPVYCVIAAGHHGSTPLGCAPFAAVDDDVPIFQSGGSSGQPIVALVPDGVASVRISYRARAPIVVPVEDNALVFAPPPPTARVMADEKRLGRLRTAGGYCSRGRAHGTWRCHVTRLTKAQELQRKQAVAEYDAALAAADPTTVEWLDRSGRPVRTLEPPTAARIAATSVGDLRAPIGG